MTRTVLVAVGGNALMRAGEGMSVSTERVHVQETCRALGSVIARGFRVVVTHGNGPQVGAALRRSELAASEVYGLPLDLCVASTQGEIGALFVRALDEQLVAQGAQRPIATIVSQTVVAAGDPAFTAPAKPVGPFYTRLEADAHRREGWMLVDEPPHGYRRVVPSPEPVEILEESAIRALLDAGIVVIAVGGGGVPVVRRGARIEGIDAVIDKDLASALLAIQLHVDTFVLCTDVDRVYVNHATPSAFGLGDVTASELRSLSAAGQFPAGTMGPKVEAALRFVAATGREAIVTSPERLLDAIEGREGTHILNEEQLWTAFAR